jgi:hypothetical protein
VEIAIELRYQISQFVSFLQHWAQKARAGWELLGKGTICAYRDRTLFGKPHASPTNKKLLLWTASQDNGHVVAALLATKATRSLPPR